MRIKKNLMCILLLILLSFPLYANEGWDKAVSRVKQNIGLIEYFEQIGSAEAIEEKSRIKKHLTGILVDQNGLMITSASLFRAQLEFTSSSIFSKARLPEDIMVRFPGKDPVAAEFVGKDDDKGLAFIRLKEPVDMTPVVFKKNNSLKIGRKILVVQHLGRRYNYELIVSERSVNAEISVPVKRYLCEDQINTLSDFGLVTDFNGNGLGVLLNSDDQLSAGRFGGQSPFSRSLASILAFDSFNKLLENPPVYREKETSRKKWLGINMQPFTRAMAEYYDVPEIKGVLVNTILEDSPAAKSGLQVGDVITAVNETKVEAQENNDLQVFRNLIREQVDDLVTFELFRDGQLMKLDVSLSDIPIGQFLAEEVTNASLGFSVKELTKDIILAQQLDFDTQGVWVSRVENAGWSDIAGLRIGDLILEIDQNPVSGLDDIREYFDEIETTKPEYISLFIKRRTETRFLFIKTNFQE